MTDVFALGALCLPGWALARWLCGPRDVLETAVLSVAFGRMLLAALSLVATSLAIPALVGVYGLAAWLGAALAAGALVWRRKWPQPRGLAPATVAGAVAVVALALGLGWAVVARSPEATSDGGLVFHGRHPTADSLIYHGIVSQLLSHGLPLREPLIAAAPTSTHELFFGSLAGLVLLHGEPALDVTFRLRPLLDLSALALTALALARSLGLSAPGAAAAAGLLLLGGGLSLPLFRLAGALGVPLNLLELWSFGNAFLLPFNPAAPGLQTAGAALLLVARPGTRPDRAAAAAGVLAGLTFGMKLAVWAGLLPALALATLGAASRRRVLRRVFLAALLASLPLLLWTAHAAFSLRTAESPLPLPCPGCLARYAVASAFGDPWQETRIFDTAGAAALGDAEAFLLAIPAALVWLGLTWGARWAALPALLRAWRQPAVREGAPGEGDVRRILGAWAAVGALLTLGFHTPPHFPNAGQFAWCAAFLLWIPFVSVLEASWRAGRRIRVAALGALALCSGPAWLWQQGLSAPPVQRLDPEVAALVEAAGRATREDEIVLEPSLLLESGFPTPLAWLARRPVWASQGGMVRYLPEAEARRRRAQLEAIYLGQDAGAAARALRETGAALVVAPAGLPTPLRVGRDAEVVFSSAAGRLLRPLPPDPR